LTHAQPQNPPQRWMFASSQPSFGHFPSPVQFAHGAPVLIHWLLVLHTCGWVPLQRTLPARQRQSPAPRQIGVAPEHAAFARQVPVFVHVRGTLSAQLRTPGTHSPLQRSPTQANGQVWAAPQRPSLAQFCSRVESMHCVLPGEQAPSHTPSLHTFGHAAPSSTHVP
jgi:hypothetical protein